MALSSACSLADRQAINSAVVKLSKLTFACKVYRGINGRVLPDEFWTANDYGVRGGIESAFMSTTVDREVALEYARGGEGNAKAGFIFEIQRAWLPSQPTPSLHCTSSLLTKRAQLWFWQREWWTAAPS